ncbi:hypothetical protein PUNSTDRAFT_125459 [Punctularia strigosozonata HHB-11173 SS5]|uniref:uncharacterized protein n=1 Tax=Punctularia strigosozonata (strain HHB-11173) TaxID=741275 RepID=UPI00044175A8|nr:uncharacterized protein PUNSTDRAFT_125459 [Punctularia strigosozonata HHB-11173 SS5]EIN10757.1 hypothetical protein PUNSTDRAFT_125459 [Punctularia strigosozonata HHB-11173 SS5]
MDALLIPRQANSTSGCPNDLQCPDPAPCVCTGNQLCVQILRTCSQCGSFKCVEPSSSSSGKKGGVSTGALAGAIVGCLILFALVLGGVFFWYRRRSRLLREAQQAQPETQEVVASALDVLNRPDPNEKFQQPPAPSPQSNVRVYQHSRTTLDLDPESQRAAVVTHAHQNPFEDAQSIQTTSSNSHGTNVIPIALVPRTSALPSSQLNPPERSISPAPPRPIRTPDLDLNLEHVNVSKDSLRPGTNSGSHSPYTPSEISGISGTGNNRQSYMSNMTGATDFLNEAPTIVTPTKGAVRQVLGVAHAQVVPNTGSTGSMTSSTPNTPRHPSSLVSRPSVRSPLATTSFGPKDVVTESMSEVDEDGALSVASDPFADERGIHSQLSQVRGGDGAGSITTFSTESSLGTPVAPPEQRYRPVSLETNAASILSANIGTAARVQIGLSPLRRGEGAEDVPTTATSLGVGTPRMLTKMASGRLVTPSTANTPASAFTPTGTSDATTHGSGTSAGTLQEQQARALAHAQAKAREANLGLGPDAARRTSSGSSVISGRDSILENFPFVPPSPISARPARSPPSSPLRQQSFNNSQAQSRSALSQATIQTQSEVTGDLPKPPNRKLLGMSTVSQSSTASEGLGSFPFHIEREPSEPTAKAAPPAAYGGRTRASLDTLALTSALSSYPLGFDEASSSGHDMPR